MTVGELVAYLRLDDSHFNRGIDQAHSKLGQVGSKVGTAFKKGAIVAGAAVAGLVGTALVKGFQRLSSIENATAKLKGLGHSAADVQLIMDNALASVKGTAYGLDEAAGVAATTVASGIKPGQQLEATLRLVADAATISGESLGEMGSVFNKVAASNKMQGDVMAQLNDAGIPIQQFLAKSLGVTIAKVYELSKAGKISFPMFAKAMEKGLGGAALASGKTATGAWKNMMAALSRLGAAALSGIFPSIPAMFTQIGALFDRLQAKYGPILKAWGEKIAAGFKAGGISGALKVILPEGIANDLITTFNVIKDTTVAIVKVLGGIGKVFVSLPGDVQKFAIAVGLLGITLGKFGLLGSAKGLLGGLLGKGGGAATEVPLTTAMGLNTAATEANTLALMGKGGLPGGGKTPLPLGAPGGTKPSGGGWSSLLSNVGKVLGAGAIATTAGDLLKGTGADYNVAMDKMAEAAGEGGKKSAQAFTDAFKPDITAGINRNAPAATSGGKKTGDAFGAAFTVGATNGIKGTREKLATGQAELASFRALAAKGTPMGPLTQFGKRVSASMSQPGGILSGLASGKAELNSFRTLAAKGVPMGPLTHFGERVAAVQRLEKQLAHLRADAGRPTHMGKLDATQMINEIARVSGALGDMRSAARTAGNAAANAIKSPSGGGGSYRGHFMAAGGYVPPRAGGTPVVLGEAGKGEWVIPESQMGGGGTHFHFHVGQLIGTDERAARQLWNTVKPIAMSEMRLKGAMSRG